MALYLGQTLIADIGDGQISPEILRDYAKLSDLNDYALLNSSANFNQLSSE